MADQGATKITASWRVPAGEGQIRADIFAGRCLPHLSRRQIERAIAERFFRVNGKTVKKGDRLEADDRLDFCGAESLLASGPVANDQLHVPIVYEDAELLVVNKPAGLAVHGFSAQTRNTLANFLAAQRPSLLQVGKSRWEPGIVHRLDRETSGLVVVAKTAAAFEHLRRQFRERKIGKTYLALVWGESPTDGMIDFPLAHDSRDRRRMRALTGKTYKKRPKSWPAVTRYRRLGMVNGLSLLEVEMATGVTHQIRVHLATIGHAIVGDRLYGDPDAETFALQRHFLHAWKLHFNHPTAGQKVSVEAQLSEDLQELLTKLAIRF